mmetsp:Transcript_21264/g.23669  ORF Transcript_21264/g.23669 Transcript_21264/m.23669 type:complete len:180 (+) Transcript_21264:25-564(+)
MAFRLPFWRARAALRVPLRVSPASARTSSLRFSGPQSRSWASKAAESVQEEEEELDQEEEDRPSFASKEDLLEVVQQEATRVSGNSNPDFSDLDTKFKVLSAAIDSTAIAIPSQDLGSIGSVQAVADTLWTLYSAADPKVGFELLGDLPPNVLVSKYLDWGEVDEANHLDESDSDEEDY